MNKVNSSGKKATVRTVITQYTLIIKGTQS